MKTTATIYRVKTAYNVFVHIEKDEDGTEWLFVSNTRMTKDNTEMMKITKRTKKGFYVITALFKEQYITYSQLEELE